MQVDRLLAKPHTDYLFQLWQVVWLGSEVCSTRAVMLGRLHSSKGWLRPQSRQSQEPDSTVLISCPSLSLSVTLAHSLARVASWSNLVLPLRGNGGLVRWDVDMYGGSGTVRIRRGNLEGGRCCASGRKKGGGDQGGRSSWKRRPAGQAADAQ